jgi:hypothetical protein
MSRPYFPEQTEELEAVLNLYEQPEELEAQEREILKQESNLISEDTERHL